MGLRIGTGLGPVRVSTRVGSGKGCGTTIVVMVLLGLAFWVWPLAVGGLLAYIAFSAAKSDDDGSGGSGCLAAFGLIFIIGALVGQMVWIVHLSDKRDSVRAAAPPTTTDRTVEPWQTDSADLSEWVAASAGAPAVVASAGRLLDEIYLAASEDRVPAAQRGCERIAGDANRLKEFRGPGQPERWDDFILHVELMVEACLASGMGRTVIEHDKAISALQDMSAEVNGLN